MPAGIFPLGGPVPREDIVHREDFLISLISRLSAGQSVILSGPRRIGKTSLAHEVLRRLKEQGYYTGTVDFFRMTGKRDLATHIINACLENRTGLGKTMDALKDRARAIAGTAKLAVKIEDLELILGFPQQEPDEEKLLDYALELPGVLAERDNKQMVVLLDEFQDAGRIAGNDIYKRMRAHFQVQNKVAYLFLGSKEGMMETLFGDRKQAFYRFATMLPLPPIPEQSWISYITHKFNSRGVGTDRDSLVQIIDKTGGHPQDTMLVCSEIFYALLEAGQNKLSREMVRLGYERAMLTLTPVFDEMLDETSRPPAARRVLRSLATGGGIYSGDKHPNETKRAVDLLITKAIIEKKSRGSYAFVEPMFKDYLTRIFA